MTMSKSLDRSPRRQPRRWLFFVVGALVLGVAFLLLRAKERPASGPAPAAKTKLVDVRGRAVEVTTPAHRLAIDDSRYLVALGLLHPDPGSLLASWAHDVQRLGPETYQQYLRKSPGLDKLPKVASSAGSFDVESLLAAAPDAALLSLESGITNEQIERVQAAGVPVLIVDFFVKPFENLERSLLVLGELVGRAEQAREVVAFRAEHMRRISARAASFSERERPLVFLEAHAGMATECCNSPGKGNIGDYIQFVGGHNIGADALSQPSGKLNLEYVISRDPKVYIGTGGPHLAKDGGLVVGAGFDRARAHESLAKVVERRGISSLSAVKTGHVHGFSHQLLNSPLDVVAIEAFARWIHPETFGDIDPAATLAEINRRFLAVPYEGVYWVDL